MLTILPDKATWAAALGLVACLSAMPAAAQTVDGTCDPSYPAALALQATGTTFGDNNLNSQTLANGSELDNIHARIVGSDLYLFIGGNLESNFNKLDLFFDSKSGGQNLLNNNPNYVGAMNGLRFDSGFAADYALEVNCGNNPLQVYANYANLPTGGGGTTADYIGGGTGRTQTVTFSNAVAGTGTGAVSIDNSNQAGVAAGTGAASASAVTAVSTGIEYRIPLAALGTTANGGDIKIIAFVNSGARDFIANQVLGSLPLGYGNLGAPSGVNFGGYPGDQFVTVANGGGRPMVDGVVDASLYGPAKALQTNPTGFGDNLSELDGAYARVDGTDLYLTLTGNLETGGNKLVLFFDADPDTGQGIVLANNPTVDFGASGNLAGLTFDQGFHPESFLSLSHSAGALYANYALLNSAGGNGTYLSTSSNAFTQTLDFGNGRLGELSFDNSNTAGVTGTAVGTPGPVMTGIELRIPLSVLGGTVTANSPLHVMALLTNGSYDYLSNQTLGGLPNGTGNLGLNGTGGGTLPNTVSFHAFADNQFFTAQRGDLTISDNRAIAGDYRNITITPTGWAYVWSPLDVTGTLLTQGWLSFYRLFASPPDNAYVSGTGTSDVRGWIGITSPAGIMASGNTGHIRTATRLYGSDAAFNYLSNPPTIQFTGTGLPATVRVLAIDEYDMLMLSQPLSIREKLVFTDSGTLNTNGQPLTLLSDAAGTALVVNADGSAVVGNVTVQRYIDPSLNAGPGYRHYAAPVSNTTLADLQTSGFTPELSQASAYNTSATPGTVTPFPNVFGYDESRVLTSPATAYTPFDRGWVAPAAGAAWQVGKGYTVNIAGTEKVDFVGTLNTGNQTQTLPRTGGPDGGWNLVGNPYPAPLDWSRVVPADRPGLDAAAYVFESTSQYAGQYRAAVNGVGSSARIASSQGFFVRVSDGQASGSLTLRNSHRLTDYAQQATFRRGSADLRPQVQLTLAGAGGQDEAYVYFEAGATIATDAAYDAVKLPNSHGLNLASVAGGQALAINGLPAVTAATIVPLTVTLPAAGTYTFEAAALLNLAPGSLFLMDAVTGQQINLHQQARYAFTAASTTLNGRFALHFAPAAALAAGTGQARDAISVFPNPARQHFTVLVPVTPQAATVAVTLYNSLGQVVRRTSQAAVANSATAVRVDAAGLAAGVYSVQVQAGTAAPVTKRVVLE